MEKCGWNLPVTRKVCSRDPEEVQDDGLQGHEHTYGIEPESIEYGLKYDMNKKINLEGYMDSYWENSSIHGKRTSGCCFNMRSGVISWFRRKESCMALSTTKEKYVATCIFCMMQRGAVKLQYVIQIEISQKREF